MASIVSYGTYVPIYRISVEEISSVWKKSGQDISRALGLTQKSVPGVDEDAVTLAIEASRAAIVHGDIDEKSIGVVFTGSESHPYAVNPTSTIVGELLGLGTSYLAADLQFACKAATAGMQAVAGLVDSGQITTGLVVGSDTAQSKPHDALEYASASASAAFILGKKGVADLLSYVSFSSDTPDFWRRDGMRYPSHAGRFTGEPAYFTHVLGAATALLSKARITPKDVTHCVFHMPNGKFPREVAKRLGFSSSQLTPSLIVDSIGNPYAASTLTGLAAVLDIAHPGDTIFAVSYGSGAGSDGFYFRVTERIKELQEKRKKDRVRLVDRQKNIRMISYVDYLQQTHKL